MEYGAGQAPRGARCSAGSARAAELPGNDEIEDEVRAYLALFCADTQPAELAALRAIAARWMERLAAFRPHLTGAVWRGTATRLNDIHLELFCDDSKAAEIALIDQRVDYDVGSRDRPARRERRRAEPVERRARRSASRVTRAPHRARPRRPARRAASPTRAGAAERGDLAALRALLGGAHEPARASWSAAPVAAAAGGGRRRPGAAGSTAETPSDRTGRRSGRTRFDDARRRRRWRWPTCAASRCC